MIDNDEEIIPTNENEADELLDSVETPDHEPIKDEAPAPAAPVDEFAFTVGGKEIKANRDKVLKWAQMGYDAPTRIGKLNQELEQWKSKEQGFKAMQDKYGPVDEYVKQNPKFWEHVLQSYQQREQVLNDTSNPLAQTVTQMQQQLQDLMQYKTQIEQQQQSRQMQQEDAAYQGEITEIKKAYPQVDLETPDESGKSLEYRVLEYANQNGIKKFTTAFRDFYHDELKKMYEAGAKESISKDRMKNTKLGILGKTTTPTRRVSDDVKGKSWGDLEREALQELGITN